MPMGNSNQRRGSLEWLSEWQAAERAVHGGTARGADAGA